MPSYSNCESNAGRPIAPGSSPDAACDWYGTFSAVTTANGTKKQLVTFGAERCVPRSMLRLLGRQVVFVDNLDLGAKQGVKDASLDKHTATTESHLRQATPQNQIANPNIESHSESIAVVGMSIKTAVADELAEFAEMLKTGKTQHELVRPVQAF